MAKSSRASTLKSNNQRLKRNVFGPVEAARAERLSAKLLALASEPKPIREVEMKTDKEDEPKDAPADKQDVMEVDSGSKPAKKATGKKRVQKRVNKIVFPKYGEKKISKKRYSK